MKNYEKYAKELKEYDGLSFCEDFVIPYITKNRSRCGHTSCIGCQIQQMIWLLGEYEEPKTDWSKVEVDTPILVKNSEDDEWHRRYFAKYEDGYIYAWRDGCTSWTAYSNDDVTMREYAKLAESEESNGN